MKPSPSLKFITPFPKANSFHGKIHWNLNISTQCITIINDQSLTDTIQKVRAEAQKLLEVANNLQGRDFILCGEIERHVATVTQTELWQCLLKPMRVRFKSTPVSPFQPSPSTSRSQITQRPPVQYAQTHRQLRCFQCESPHHIKWHCDLYICKKCGQRAPGHSQGNCPGRYIFDDDTRGHFDIEGEFDGNLNGEC